MDGFIWLLIIIMFIEESKGLNTFLGKIEDLFYKIKKKLARNKPVTK